MHMSQESDLRAGDNAKRGPGLRKRKGWIGFVWGYKDFVAVADKIWHKINWGEDGKLSGAKEIEKDPNRNKTVYYY